MKKYSLHLVVILIMSNACFAQTTRPYQFVAKMYTEAYGRVVDPSGWSYWQGRMTNENPGDLMREMIRVCFTNAEFKNDYPIIFSQSPTLKREQFRPRLLALYRGALNREPDNSGFSSFLNRLQVSSDETIWDQVVNEFAAPGNTELNALISSILASGKPYYGWVSNAVNDQNGIYTSGKSVV